ncbi:MAG: hypothetical protein ACOYOL_06105 [Chthoniobacterales bacterium]
MALTRRSRSRSSNRGVSVPCGPSSKVIESSGAEIAAETKTGGIEGGTTGAGTGVAAACPAISSAHADTVRRAGHAQAPHTRVRTKPRRETVEGS